MRQAITPPSRQLEAILRNPKLPDDLRRPWEMAAHFASLVWWLQAYLVRPDAIVTERIAGACTGRSVREIAYPVVVGQYMARAIRLSIPLIELVACAWGDAAALLARSLMELGIRLQWISRQERDIRALIHLCIATEEKITALRRLRAHRVQSSLSEKEREALQQMHGQTYQSARGMLRDQLQPEAKRKSVSVRQVRIQDLLPRLRTMFDECGQLAVYDVLYSELSVIGHNSLESLRAYTSDREGGGVVVEVTGGSQWCEESIVIGYEKFLDILAIWREVFGLPHPRSRAKELDHLVQHLRSWRTEN